MKIAVIGGGIVGATTAFYLTEKGIFPTLFDAGNGQATKAAAGIISPWLSQRRNQEWYELAKQGARLYPQLIADLNASHQTEIYQQVGTLLFKDKEHLLDKLEKIAYQRRKDAPEIGQIERLSPTQIKEKIPLLETQKEALFVSGGARVDGQLLIKFLLSKIAEKGQVLQEKVTEIQPLANGRWRVIGDKTSAEFDKLAVTTGAWLPELIEPLGFKVDIRAQKGQLVECQLADETNNWPVVMPQGESDLIPFPNGKLLVGASHEDQLDYDLTKDQTVINTLIESQRQLAPALVTAQQKRIRVGTRAYTSDFSPFFGEVATKNNLFVASGLGSSGLTTGPMIGQTLANWLLGQETILDKEAYSPERYLKKSV